MIHVGVEQPSVAGQMQQVQHYRLTGKVNVDLWYDGHNRLVRQEFEEQKHRTLIELSGSAGKSRAANKGGREPALPSMTQFG